MQFPSANIVVDVYPEAVSRNWRHLSSFANSPPSGWPGAMAVIKADAYGHGLLPVSRALLAAGARAFAVGTVAEGVKLVRALGRADLQILPLLGPQNIRETDRCLAHNLVPLIHRPGQVAMLAARVRASGKRGRVPVAIKVDTGLCRLGFGESTLAGLFAELEAADNLAPSLLLSHYAKSDAADDRNTTEDQAQLFLRFLAAFRVRWPETVASLANSAALLNSPPALFRELGANIIRPGISLYGPNPFAGTVLEKKGAGLVSAMDVRCPILEVKGLAAGAKISYGHTFIAQHPMRIAVLAAGYADGMSRRLSSAGEVCVHGKRAPRIGRVCMQMHMVDVSDIPECKAGDTAHILGGPGDAVSADELAAWWGSIPHELFCSLGKNPRVIRKGLPVSAACEN